MPTRIYNKLSSQPTPKVIQFTKLKEKMPMASQLSAPTMVSTSAITLKTLTVLFTSKSLLIYLLVVCVLWQNICIAVCQGLLTSPCISGIITKMCCNVASLSKRPYVLDVTQKRLLPPRQDHPSTASGHFFLKIIAELLGTALV